MPIRREDIERDRKRITDEIKDRIARGGGGLPDGVGVGRAEVIFNKRDAKHSMVEIMLAFNMTPLDTGDIIRDFVARMAPPRLVGTGLGAVAFNIDSPGFSVASVIVDGRTYNKAEFAALVDSLPPNVGEDEAEVISSENGTNDNVMEDIL